MHKMRSIDVVQPLSSKLSWSAAYPAPSTALVLTKGQSPSHVLQAGEVLVQVKAVSVIRDNLTWPELYSEHPARLGNDFAGVVLQSLDPTLQQGDEVYGMIDASRGGAWADIIVVKTEEVYLKPKVFSWVDAAVVPLSALTADQALNVHAKLNQEARKRILITGAAGGVGTYLVQFGLAMNQDVVAASSSNARNWEFLNSLGVQNALEYEELETASAFDVIIDTVGGKVLESCWKYLQIGGSLITIDSGSWNFVKKHNALGLTAGHETSTPVFFIVEPSRAGLRRVGEMAEQGQIKVMVSKTFPFERFKEAYDLANSRTTARGRVALVL